MFVLTIFLKLFSKIEKEKTKEIEALEEEHEDIPDDVDSIISHNDEEEEQLAKKQRIISKRQELLNDWEFPDTIGRVQNYENIILEFINVKNILHWIFHSLNHIL